MKKLVVIILITFALLLLWSKPLPLYIDGSQNPMIIHNTNLGDFVQTQIPFVKAALIVGSDSIAVGVTADEFGMISLKYENNEWFVENDSLPSPANIRDISKIYLYNPFASVTSSSDSNRFQFTDIRNNADFLGQAEKNGYIIWKYRIHQGVNK